MVRPVLYIYGEMSLTGDKARDPRARMLDVYILRPIQGIGRSQEFSRTPRGIIHCQHLLPDVGRASR
jgi:hypothetical protein